MSIMMELVELVEKKKNNLDHRVEQRCTIDAVLKNTRDCSGTFAANYHIFSKHLL